MPLQLGWQDLAPASKPGLTLGVAVPAAERKEPKVPKEIGMAGRRTGWGMVGGMRRAGFDNPSPVQFTSSVSPLSL